MKNLLQIFLSIVALWSLKSQWTMFLHAFPKLYVSACMLTMVLYAFWKSCVCLFIGPFFQLSLFGPRSQFFSRSAAYAPGLYIVNMYIKWKSLKKWLWNQLFHNCNMGYYDSAVLFFHTVCTQQLWAKLWHPT